MHRFFLIALLGIWSATFTACVEPGAPHPDPPETSTFQGILEPPEEDCDYITCGRNTRTIGNRVIDHVYFDGTPNDRGQQFLHWRTAGGETLTPHLTSRMLGGALDGWLRVGTALNGSVITLIEDGELVKLRFVDARYEPLPNGLSIWVHHLEVWRSITGWRPLCPLFDHTPSVIARYAIPGTREVIHVGSRTITTHAPAEGKLTLGCPNSATGKMLSLGALTTTAAVGQESTPAEMRATLLALTLSPLGSALYTEDGVMVMFHVQRTGLDNSGETLSGGLEGKWDENGAICFDRLRSIPDDRQWDLWSDTHVPSCSEIDVPSEDVLVSTHRYFGYYPAYPPPPPPPPRAETL